MESSSYLRKLGVETVPFFVIFQTTVYVYVCGGGGGIYVVIAILAECCEGKEVMGDLLALKASLMVVGGFGRTNSDTHTWTLGH